MNLIAAVDKNWGIGKEGRLLAVIPQDQRRFREMTLGGVVIMGRKTLESLPGGKPLGGRHNIVLSGRLSFQAEGARVCHSVKEVLMLLEQEPYCSGQIYVIGGESVYRQFLPYCDRACVTVLDISCAADVYMPDLDADRSWNMTEESGTQVFQNLRYTYRLYERVKSEEDEHV